MMHLFKFGFHHNRPPSVNMGPGLLLNGLLCIAFALVIFAAPEILAYLVAILLLIMGASLLTAWWKLKNPPKHWSRGV